MSDYLINKDRIARELKRWLTPNTKWENASPMQQNFYITEAERLLAIIGIINRESFPHKH